MPDETNKLPDGKFRLTFHYIKGPEYREGICHGAIGGVTPGKKIWMAIYAERPPIPRVVEYHVATPEGATEIQFNEQTAGKADYVDTRSGIVRHIEYGTYLDLSTAENIHAWLGERIKQLKADNG